MVSEAVKYGTVMDMPPGEGLTLDLTISPQTFDLKTGQRPRGWAALQDKRVYARELTEVRDKGLNEATIANTRPRRKQEEERRMVDEVAAYGDVLVVGGPGSSGLVVGQGNFDASNPVKRPAGWAALRQRRITAKERADRAAGLSEDIIAERSKHRLQEVHFCNIHFIRFNSI
jgi:hypothetical protein